jgi:hypothetical protein
MGERGSTFAAKNWCWALPGGGAYRVAVEAGDREKQGKKWCAHANEEDFRIGAEALAAMDSSETPGSRVSVDTGELRVERAL